MPLLIPETCHSTSTAERHIFDLLKAHAPEDWIILHSLKPDKAEREIDFVVLVPEKGVVCLEVKGGQISYDSRTNLWTSIGAGGTQHKIDDPFAQAASAARALRTSVLALQGGGDFANLPVCHGVMFPDVTRLPTAMVEREGFRIWFTDPDRTQDRINTDLAAYITALCRHTQTRYPYLRGDRFTPDEARRYARLLRSDAVFERNLWDIAKLTERDLERALTEQQRTVLAFVRANRTAVVQGGAGTGKTLLAVRAAREELTSGRRVLLVCHNELLGGFFAQSFAASALENHQHNLIVSGDMLAVIVKLSGIPAPDKKLQTKETLEAFYAAAYNALETKPPELFDTLIIDEGQDMVDIQSSTSASEKSSTSESVDSSDTGGVERMLLLDRLLKGGFSEGRWRFFWDPEQNIFDYSSATDERKRAMQVALEEYLGKGFTNVPLHQNCRNTRQIGNAAARVGKLPQSEYFPSAVEGVAVEYRVYKNDEEQLQHLRECLTALKAQGVHDWNITILSWLTFEKSIVSKLKGFSVRDLAKYSTIPADLTAIGFSTIGRYKGLENHFIIITDVQDGRFRPKQLYVAMTRAKTHLCVLMSEKRRVDLEPLLSSNV